MGLEGWTGLEGLWEFEGSGAGTAASSRPPWSVDGPLLAPVWAHRKAFGPAGRRRELAQGCARAWREQADRDEREVDEGRGGGWGVGWRLEDGEP
eukprot:4664789-Pyramimonas_sp.AAC.1